MTFVLTPRFAPAYQASHCGSFGLCAPVSRPTYTYRVARPRPQRPQYSSFNHFFSQVDELLSEIDREAQRHDQIEAQRKAHYQRQQRKRALRAKFSINQTEQGWQVDGELQGFDQENISLEVTDEHTIKISGNTQWEAEKPAKQTQDEVAIETKGATEQRPAQVTSEDKMDGVTLNEPDFETVTEADSATVEADSDTESQKSYQATVEDDFEDLGAETSSLISSTSKSTSPTEVKEIKDKERAAEEPKSPESQPGQQPESVTPTNADSQHEVQKEERVHGSFERTFRFAERIDVSNVNASFKDGALTIIVPRAQPQQVRRIAIL